jgi:hypothetical protein
MIDFAWARVSATAESLCTIEERCDAVKLRGKTAAQHQRGVVDKREDVQDARVAGPALHTAHAASNLFYAAPRLDLQSSALSYACAETQAAQDRPQVLAVLGT